jgi:FkbM family methyltransferase
VRYFEGYIWIKPKNWLEAAVFKTGRFEPASTEILRSACSQGFSLIDVGSHIGTHSIAGALAARAKALATVHYAFEPIFDFREALSWNVRQNGLQDTIRILPYGLGESETELDFDLHLTGNPGMTGHSCRQKSGTTTRVTIRTMDSLLKNSRIPDLVVKIDVEGMELDVLKGAVSTIGNANNVVLLLEHETTNLIRSGRINTSIQDWLVRNNFRFWEISEADGVLKPYLPEKARYCNVLAVRGSQVVDKIPLLAKSKL